MFRITTLLTLTAGTASLMVISDEISRRQIGNGMFLVFVAGIVAGLSRALGLVDPVAALTYAVLQTAVAALPFRAAIVAQSLRPNLAEDRQRAGPLRFFVLGKGPPAVRAPVFVGEAPTIGYM